MNKMVKIEIGELSGLDSGWFRSGSIVDPMGEYSAACPV